MILTLIALSSLSFASSEIPADSVSYYYGDVTYSSKSIPQNNLPKATHSLIKRTTSPAHSQIIELLIQPPRKDGANAFQSTTTISRVDSTNTFVATDDLHSFIGKIRFSGWKDWAWTSFKYHLRFTGGYLDGTLLEGKAKIDKNGLHISKKTVGSFGEMDVTEEHRAITAEQYEACKATLLSSHSSTETCE